MSSPRGKTISKEGQQTALDDAATPTVPFAGDHDIGSYHEYPSFQVHSLAQRSENASRSSVSTPVSVTVLAEALSTPLSHLQEQIVRSSSSINSTSLQNLRSGASNTSVNQPTWERPRSPRAALEPEDWEFEPERSFGQVCMPARNFKELSERRFAVIASRVNVRELRKKLRGQREVVNEAIGHIIQELRVSILKGGKQNVDDLRSQYETLQELHERLRLEDDDYDLLEKGLIDQEWTLRLAEDVFYHRSSIVSSHANPSLRGKSPAPGFFRTPHSRSAPQSSPDDSGFLTRRSQQVSEIELVRAKLGHLESEYMELREEEHLRTTLGRTLDEDSSFALRVFPVRQAELLHYLSFYEERATERQQILDDSIDQFPTYQYTGYDLEVLARKGSTNGLPGSPDVINIGMSSDEAADLSDDPLLLSSASEQAVDAEVCIHSIDTQIPSTPHHLAYINDWLLYTLRCSRFAVMQLKSNFGDLAKSLDAQTLKSMVLSLWYTDETSAWYEESAEHAAQSYNSSSLSALVSMQLRATWSDPNLLIKHKRLETVRQSRSAFVHRSEVKDLVFDLSGPAVDKGLLRV